MVLKFSKNGRTVTIANHDRFCVAYAPTKKEMSQKVKQLVINIIEEERKREEKINCFAAFIEKGIEMERQRGGIYK